MQICDEIGVDMEEEHNVGKNQLPENNKEAVVKIYIHLNDFRAPKKMIFKLG